MSVFRQSYPSENEFDVHVLKCTLFSTLFQYMDGIAGT
jgi:hypothetical protein